MNKFFVLANNFSFLYYFRIFLSEFLILRGFSYYTSISSFYFNSNLFSFIDFTFITVNDSFVYSFFSEDFLLNYKLKLKMLVKNFGFVFNTFDFLKLLNKFIFFWSINYNFLNCIFDIWSNLDVYLYKILWRWTKRRHPRRPNTWIYSKYWKLFSGVYRFYSVNCLTGSFLILRSHFFLNIAVARLPLACNFYSNLDTKKFDFFTFNRFKNSFLGLFKYYWYKQKGLCFICKKSFTTLNFNSIKICTFGKLKNNISCFFLVHNYCYS